MQHIDECFIFLNEYGILYPSFRCGVYIMNRKVTLTELQNRMNALKGKMLDMDPDWKLVVIISKINQYYFTGTMQDGMLLIPRDDQAEYWVRRSFERAADESLFPVIHPMESYRDVAWAYGRFPSDVYLETEFVPLAMLQRIQKYFPFENVKPVDPVLASVRAVKSAFELDLMREAGRIHQRVLEQRVPEILREGMSEAELATQLYSILIQEGHQGVTRFGMFDTEMVIGNICFGKSSIYPTYFNGPGGNYGLGASVPTFGSRENRLKAGDLVFIDIGCGVDGYHTDKTMTYVFGGDLPEEVIQAHQRCIEIQNRMAALLQPGSIPETIYKSIMNSLDQDFLQNFMGFGSRRVKFLGHGIGLLIDEAPVIAEGFREPMQEGMVFALEPKKGFDNIGMVGIENTFIVTAEGAECITGHHPGLLRI